LLWCRSGIGQYWTQAKVEDGPYHLALDVHERGFLTAAHIIKELGLTRTEVNALKASAPVRRCDFCGSIRPSGARESEVGREYFNTQPAGESRAAGGTGGSNECIRIRYHV